MAIRSLIKVSLLVSATAGIPTLAFAQETRTATGTAFEQDGDIIVTAQKREERLLDVPLSVTAIGEDTIEKRGATAIEDLQYSVPGMSITQFSPGQQRIQMRGISVFAGLPTVGVYLDEQPLNNEINQTGQDVRLLDIKRIEVLRGPQGTLYGQGSLGGTVRYITNDANYTKVEGSAAGEVGFIDGGGTDWKTEGMVNVPLVTDRAGARVAASYQRFGGWIDNPVLGSGNVNGGHAFTVRGKLGFQLGDPFELKLMVQHQDLDLGAANLSDANQKVFDQVPTPIRSKVTIANALATYDLGPATLLSSTGFIWRRDRQGFDFTPSFGPFLPGVQLVSSEVNSRSDIFTQEVRLSSNAREVPFSWTLGGFYRKSESRAVFTTNASPQSAAPPFDIFSSNGTYPEDSESWAVFGEATYALTPALKALVGARYFEDERKQDVVNTVFGGTAIDKQQKTFTTFSPRFNLSWQPSDQVNIYANVAKGFRSGGFNRTSSGGGVVAVPASYDPETLWSYELGGKFQTSDRKLVAEVAVYRNDWRDVLSLAFALGLPIQYTQNGGRVAGWGVEGSLSYQPAPGLTLSGTASWNNMAYTTTTAEHIKGDPADYVPRFTGSISAEYRFQMAEVPAFFRLDYQYSDAWQSFVRTFQTVAAKTDQQNLFNARAGVEFDRWSVAVFAKNILNRDSVIYPSFGSLAYPARIQPRVVGVSASLNF